MKFVFDTRSSDSSFVEAVWRSHSVGGGSFTSMAGTNMEVVITKQADKTTLTVRGPETKARPAPVPEDAEFVGIIFKMGSFMHPLPPADLVNGGVNLPEASSKSFWLNGSAWQFPDFENTDTFINRLVRDGVLMHEPVVEAALQGHLKELSLRSVQRRFLQATGLTHKTVQQIKRAHKALELLQQGKSILDTVFETGYFDQSHLTNSLKYYLGQTPAQIAQQSQLE